MIQTLGSFASNPVVSGVLFAIGAAVVGLWLAAAWWTYADAARRTESEPARLLATGLILVSSPLLIPLSLGVWAAVRPQATLAERRSRTLAAALGPVVAEEVRCGVCGSATDPDWRRCPTCTEWLQAPCSHCGAWSDLELDHCPYCGSDALDLPRVTALPPFEVVPARGLVPAPGIAAFVADGSGGAAGAAHEAADLADEAEAAGATAESERPRVATRWRDGRDGGRRTVEAPGAPRIRRSGAREPGGRVVRTRP